MSEFKVGEQFKEGNTTLQVVEDLECEKCFYHLKNMGCHKIICSNGERSDHKNVGFKIVVNLSLSEIIDRNYKANVRRGKIKPETSFYDFTDKMEEEHQELLSSYMPIENEFDAKELADKTLVNFAMAKHYGIDLLKVMEEKTLYNETRED